jgi:hypothetical protein
MLIMEVNILKCFNPDHYDGNLMSRVCELNSVQPEQIMEVFQIHVEIVDVF